jgi:kanamycin nucleotidyltransferase
MIWQGPQAHTTAQRMAMVERLVAHIHHQYPQRVTAIGLYGSLGQGKDLPFSDIELFCVLNSGGDDFDYEWIYGTGKAEINFRSQDIFYQEATTVEDDWALTHGCYVYAKPLHGSDTFFTDLKQRVLSAPNAAFQRAISQIIAHEVYEAMGKVRNLQHGDTVYDFPRLALHMAESGALMLGLWHRHCYTSRARMFAESLTLASRPAGYDALCSEVMTGNLREPLFVIYLLENLWEGIGTRAMTHDIDMTVHTTAPF